MYPLNNQFNNQYMHPASNMDWIIVQSIEQAESVQVQPNSKAWIMIQNEPVFALRTANNMGLVTTDFYKFEKYEPHKKPEYITAEQFTKALEDLRREIKNEQSDNADADEHAEA